jgi:hypothetical protein
MRRHRTGWMDYFATGEGRSLDGLHRLCAERDELRERAASRMVDAASAQTVCSHRRARSRPGVHKLLWVGAVQSLLRRLINQQFFADNVRESSTTSARPCRCYLREDSAMKILVLSDLHRSRHRSPCRPSSRLALMTPLTYTGSAYPFARPQQADWAQRAALQARGVGARQPRNLTPGA